MEQSDGQQYIHNRSLLIGRIFNIKFFYIPAVSTWALATPEELEEALTSWKKKIDDGTADQVIKDVNSVRRELGETTTLVAFKGLL